MVGILLNRRTQKDLFVDKREVYAILEGKRQGYIKREREVGKDKPGHSRRITPLVSLQRKIFERVRPTKSIIIW